MSAPPPRRPTGEAEPRSRRYALIMVVCGLILGVCSRLGKLLTVEDLTGRSVIHTIFSCGQIASLGVFAIGLIWLVLGSTTSTSYGDYGNVRQPGQRRPSDWLLFLATFLSAAFGALFLASLLLFRSAARPTYWLGILGGGFVLSLLLLFVVIVHRRGGRSYVVPAAITLACVLVLTGGATLGYLATCSWSPPAANARANHEFGVAMLVGMALCIVAFLWLLIAAVLRLGRKEGE